MTQYLTKPVVVAGLCLALVLPAPLFAQESEEEGLSLMERGARLFLEGIVKEMEPAIEDLKDLSSEMEPALRQFVQDMGPAFYELLDKVDDITLYHAPELLPNGDIIMRRKQPEENTPPTDEGEADGSIDL